MAKPGMSTDSESPGCFDWGYHMKDGYHGVTMFFTLFRGNTATPPGSSTVCCPQPGGRRHFLGAGLGVEGGMGQGHLATDQKPTAKSGKPGNIQTPAQAEIAQNLQHLGLRKSGESAACVLVDLCGLG